MRLLLEAHVPPAVARPLRAAGVDVVTLQEWLGGDYRHAPDQEILAAAVLENRVLVTFDLQTIPLLLTEWAETRQHHAGVILVDEKTIRPGDVGGMLRALRRLVAEAGDEDWQDQVRFLPQW